MENGKNIDIVEAKRLVSKYNLENQDVSLSVKIKILNDEISESPRDWENMGRMICWSDRYTFGDEQVNGDARDALEEIASELGIAIDDDMPDSEVLEAIKEQAYIDILNVYEHSGISMSLGSRSGWDNRNVGYIYIPKETVKDAYEAFLAHQKVANSEEEYAELVMESEVSTYSDYLEGNVYGINSRYEIKMGDIVVSEGEEIFGFYGSSFKSNGMSDYVFVPIEGEERIKIEEDIVSKAGFVIGGDKIEHEVETTLSSLNSMALTKIMTKFKETKISEIKEEEDGVEYIEENGEKRALPKEAQEKAGWELVKTENALLDNRFSEFEEHLKKTDESMETSYVFAKIGENGEVEDVVTEALDNKEFKTVANLVVEEGKVMEILRENKKKREGAKQGSSGKSITR